jgi:hypothetical protein
MSLFVLVSLRRVLRVDSEHLPSFSLADRVVLVTGANRGIGRGLVDALASAGAIVAVTARNLSDADAVAAEVVAAGGDATAHALDVSGAVILWTTSPWPASTVSGRSSTRPTPTPAVSRHRRRREDGAPAPPLRVLSPTVDHRPVNPRGSTGPRGFGLTCLAARESGRRRGPSSATGEGDT